MTANIKRNDNDPSDDWIRLHYERVRRAAWVMTGNVWEAEDLAQETFVVALDRWQRFEGRSTEATWLFGILIRLRQRRQRSLARMRRRLQEYGRRDTRPTASPDPQTILSERQWQESIWASVASLPAAQRDAITLRYAENLSYAEIASILGCAAGTAKTRVHHGIQRLRRCGTVGTTTPAVGRDPAAANDLDLNLHEESILRYPRVTSR